MNEIKKAAIRRSIPGRAETSEQKRKVIEELLRIWEANPALRLGQLIDNPTNCRTPILFYLEDEALIERLQYFYRGYENA